MALYTKVNKLSLDTTQFFSCSQLLQFLRTFPKLKNICCRNEPEWELLSDEAVLAPVVKDMKAFTNVYLDRVPSAFAAKFFKLFANQCHELRELDIALIDAPGPKLQAAIDKAGAALRTFTCRYEHQEPTIPPQCTTPSLMYNTGLESLNVTFTVASSLRISWIHGTLSSLFMQLRSPCLERMIIGFYFEEPGIDAGMDLDTDLETASSDMAIFRATISHDIFSGLPPGSVTLRFNIQTNIDDLSARPFYADPTLPDQSMSMAIRSFVVPLFIPWLSHGVMKIQLPDGSLVVDPPGPDSETSEFASNAAGAIGPVIYCDKITVPPSGAVAPGPSPAPLGVVSAALPRLPRAIARAVVLVVGHNDDD
ncbi:uncharacterized protein B0H18DRAFT_1121961 [Fomitopsis serialis]|uniref:uncharacterized protein n=1 Tax=Fomitopsis serialis TaxID=139415 RepID=UPI0020073B2C|nr:uncharacterized protein B0H18DRAFT_1121961 [Neoantrodia serialis]KAH9920366.1 hypothetical protein B0H18DRAFT_1121961 [Neoantrodia serialis]